MMLLYAYLLVAVGLGLAALSLLDLLLSTAPLLWGGEGGGLPVARAGQGVVLGLGVAGIGFAMLRLRALLPASKVSDFEKSRTGWAVAAGVLVGIALAGGAAFVLVPSDGGEAVAPGDTARVASRPETATAGPPPGAGRGRELPDAAATPDTRRRATGADTTAAGSGEEPAASLDTVRGEVRLVGSTPFVRTVVEGSDTVTVRGPWEPEIARLSGARVRVVGPLRTGRYPGPTLEARQYDILAVDGERPAVGILRTGAGEEVFLESSGGDTVRLEAVPAGFRELAGAKLWVVIGESGAVQRYGVLRPVGER